MKSHLFLLIVSTFLFFSCSKDKHEDIVRSPIQNTCENEGMNKILYTECCLEGPQHARPDEIITITYTSNFEGGSYDWDVLGGSLVLVEGANTPTAKFRAGKNFKKDSIRAYSVARDTPLGAPACSEVIVITAK
ncbi:hypothetical protein QRD02_08995 [Aequorivita sp. SDUM287046]|uniref:Uncharacterized protein n=1 Tax=Aequorivita aurantiaca TaxID=3053356 RepID=A0ABT8DGV6_9FLAO|nr:hypothetical protein [Aequorivita aurantiaca]MDN3724518.1 hypothetical protein [Aequorivita aurantiaca]